MSCEAFYNAIRQGEVLVCDVRPEEEFEKCRIKSNLCVNIPPSVLDAE